MPKIPGFFARGIINHGNEAPFVSAVPRVVKGPPSIPNPLIWREELKGYGTKSLINSDGTISLVNYTQTSLPGSEKWLPIKYFLL